ncbi:hypothetical protein AYI69_g3504 [Smittium culicis]|uniref:Uncharacterized protein n=1 Tax=Smittium culicis TaxID=133412 RepID=A0A1R1YJH8_9FUNG|nr:hypothetical protein AYI69_g3504 [Smittium culicis]
MWLLPILNLLKTLDSPVSILEMISGMVPKKKAIMCMGGTPFKLGCRLGEFKVDIDLVIEQILEQINDIQSCFKIDSRRKILFLKLR